MNGADLSFLRAADRPSSFRSLSVPAGRKVLLVGPHPDDFDEVGVTLRLLMEKGHAIAAAVARTGSGVEDSYCPSPTTERKAAIREDEQRASCRFFGLPDENLVFLDLDEDAGQNPMESARNGMILERAIARHRPDLVFLPHGRDTNKGHQRMYAMFRRIAASQSRPMAALLFRDPKTTGMTVDLYTEFGEDEAEWKARLLRFHDTQHQRNLNTRNRGIDDRILEVNRTIAKELSLDAPYAEAFEVELYGVEP